MENTLFIPADLADSYSKKAIYDEIVNAFDMNGEDKDCPAIDKISDIQYQNIADEMFNNEQDAKFESDSYQIEGRDNLRDYIVDLLS